MKRAGNRPTPASMLRRFGSIAPGGGHSVVLSSLDPAARYGRSLFPSRVFAPDEIDRLLKTGHQSRKIGAVVQKGPRKGWPIFTLTLEERASCPRSCLEWASCYGNNMQAAERIEHGPDLMITLETELRALAAKHAGGFLVRLHVLGDFWSGEYVAFWRWMLAELPPLAVFGFTAHAPGSEIGRAVARTIHEAGWPRFAVRFSGAPHARHAARVLGPGEADGPEDEDGNGGAILCPAQIVRPEGHVKAGAGATDCCATCALCWQSDRAIAFRRH